MTSRGSGNASHITDNIRIMNNIYFINIFTMQWAKYGKIIQPIDNVWAALVRDFFKKTFVDFRLLFNTIQDSYMTDFHRFPAIGMSSKCQNEPRFHNTDQQFYEFWVSLFWSPGNNENLSYKSPRVGTGVNTWCHSISVTFKFWCWVPGNPCYGVQARTRQCALRKIWKSH